MDYSTSRSLSRQVPPATEPLVLAEAKLYLRVDHADDDAVILDMIGAVRDAAEQYLRRSLVTQQWKLELDNWNGADIRLPMGPVLAVASVAVIADNGSVTSINNANYRLNAGATHLILSNVQANRLRIIYSAGYGASEDVPVVIRQGMLNHLAALYEGRVALGDVPDMARHLYRPYQEPRL